MKINGFKLRRAIISLEKKKEAAVSAIQRWARDENTEPELVLEEEMLKIERWEKARARLETFQAEYNLTVVMDVKGEKLTLTEAVKRLGGIERMNRLWREMLDDGIPAIRRIGEEISTLRGSMKSANETEIEILDLEEKMLEAS